MWTTNARVFCNLSDPCVALPANLCVQSLFLIVSGMVIAQLNRLKRGSLYPSVWRLGLTIGVLALCAIAVVGLIGAERGHSATNARGDKTEAAQEGRELPVASLDKTNAAESYTRRYQVDGFELDAGFTPDKAECVFGEPVFVTFSVKNLSDKPYGFFVGGDNRGSVRHNRFRITAADSDGRPVKDPYSYEHHGGHGKDVILQAGESYTERLYLGFWCAFDKPGVFDVKCERTLTADGLEPKYPPAPIVTTFKLNILPFDKQKMREVIAGLGKKLREGDEPAVYEATLALSEIDDEAVIPHLTVSLTKGDFQNRLPAVKGLSRFAAQKAADALITALKDPDYVVGEAAGEALRKNKMAGRAIDVLLEELRNVQSSVRALAATALGYTRSERALDPLIKAMDDPTPTVGQAAAEALGKLGHKEAIEPLRKRAEGPVMDMRVAAAKGLQALGEPLPVEPLTEVVKSTTDINDQNFHESIRLIRLYGGERAAPALVSCLNFDDPSPRNAYNMFLILAIEYSPNGPKYYYKFHHDPNTDGTPEQIKENRQILDALKAWLAESDVKVNEPSSFLKTGVLSRESDGTSPLGSAGQKVEETGETPKDSRPEWRKRFDAVYRLNEAEVVRHIPEPFIAERADFFALRRSLIPIPFRMPGEDPLPEPETNVFLWNGREARDYWANPGTLKNVLRALGVRLDEMRGPDGLINLPLSGDWVLLEKSSLEQRLQALTKILEQEFGRRVRFEKRQVEEEVVVVRGKLDIKPVKADRWHELMSEVYHFLPEPALKPVHVYVDSLETGQFQVLYGDTYLDGLLEELAKKLRRRVIDETEPSDVLVGWSLHETVRREYIEKDLSRLDQLLNNLSAQTSLQFQKEKRMVAVWVIQDLRNMPDAKADAGN